MLIAAMDRWYSLITVGRPKMALERIASNVSLEYRLPNGPDKAHESAPVVLVITQLHSSRRGRQLPNRANQLPLVLQSIVEYGIEASWDHDVTVVGLAVAPTPKSRCSLVRMKARFSALT